METIKVAIVGATGVTGSSVVDGLLSSTSAQYEITALIRPASMTKPGVAALERKDIRVVPADLYGPENELVRLLAGMDVVISTIFIAELQAEIPLANAAKRAGVKRFIPCFFATVIPPRGVTLLRDKKEDILNHIKKIHLGYTVIDVGWWYQLSLPRLRSGRTDYALTTTSTFVAGRGDVPSALIDLRDIGKFVARIIADPTTLNRMVFAYTSVWTQAGVHSLMESLAGSGETTLKEYISPEKINEEIATGLSDPDSPQASRLHTLQYLNSWGVRGDNTPAAARYLGYLDANELYPDMKDQLRSLQDYFREVLDGKGVQPYGRVLF